MSGRGFAKGKAMPPPERNRDGRFLLGWGSLASLALIAVVAAVINPPVRNRPIRMAPPPSMPGAETPDDGPLYTGSIGPAAPSVGIMKPADTPAIAASTTMNKLATDVSALRQTIDTLRRQNEMLVARLDALEEKAPPQSSSGASPQASSTKVPAIKSTLQKPAEATPGADPLVTGSINRLGTDTKPAQPQFFGIDLGDYADKKTLRDNWMFYRTRASAQLYGLAPVVKAGERDGFSQFTLIAGPFDHLQDASMVCGKISTQGIACSAVAYEGVPLEPR